jgi:dUTP pyrophosphatase
MLKIKLEEGGIAPTKAYEGDAGWDLRTPFDFTLQPAEFAKVDLRIRIEGERGKYYRVEDKSGLAALGLQVRGGIVDNNYRGNIHVIIQNFSAKPIEFKTGTKVAQLLVCPVEDDNNIEVLEEINENTERGSGGFGSSGDK